MNKVLSIIAGSLAIATSLSAQTLRVNMGEVSYAHSAAQTGDMVYSAGTELTIQNRTYTLSTIDSITIDDGTVDDNTVSVAYTSSGAHVTVAGNVAQYLSVTAQAGHVTILQSADLPQEVTYTLSGTSTDGTFYMDGQLKATLVLNGLSLTSRDSAAINIQDGKRIKIQVQGTNTLSDAAGGGQNACFYVNGHSEFRGTGTLSVSGNAKHAITSDEYMDVKGPSITVTKAVGDGLHVGQYFSLREGSVTINAVGDGIDVGAKKKGGDDNGQLKVSGGTLTVTSTGETSKGLKADSAITVTAGTVNVTVTGSAAYDASSADLSSSAAVKAGGDYVMSGGNVTLTATGDGGKALNGDASVTVSGGKLVATTTGATYTYGSLDTKPHGIKADVNIALSGGEVYVAAGEDGGKAFKTDYLFTVSNCTLMGIGGKKSTPTSGRYQRYTARVTGGQTLTYNGVSYVVPANYSNSKAQILVSSPSM